MSKEYEKILIIGVLLTLILSCDENNPSVAADPTELLGTWKLVEVLADPGDGSGEFMPVESSRTITFLSFNTLNTNADFCSTLETTEDFYESSYSAVDSTINVICDNYEWNMPFEIEGKHLILSYQCIEPCAEKYEKVSN